MKKTMFAVAFVAATAFAIDVGLLNAAEDLAEGIEHLDTELHAIKAPHHVIEHVHHTEETVFEFVDLVRNPGSPYSLLKAEFAHIRVDVREIREEMRRYNYFGSARVRNEFWHVWTAYRYLDHEFYHGHGH